MKKNLHDHISTSYSLLKHNKKHFVLKKNVVGDEKWILYTIEEWKKSQCKWNEPPSTTLKAGLFPKKVMLRIWDWQGVLYHELLPEDQTINYDKCCSQLDQMKVALDEKHLELVNRKMHNLSEG